MQVMGPGDRTRLTSFARELFQSIPGKILEKARRQQKLTTMQTQSWKEIFDLDEMLYFKQITNRKAQFCGQPYICFGLKSNILTKAFGPFYRELICAGMAKIPDVSSSQTIALWKKTVERQTLIKICL